MRYGISYEERDAMVAAQNNKCAICRNEFDSDCRPEVDHCHASERVRGVLCHACNTMLGAAKDSIATLRAAADYLSSGHKAVIPDVEPVTA